MLKSYFNTYSEDRAILEQIPFSKSPFMNGLKVCVVDDHDDSLYMITFILEEYQAEIKTAKSVDDAIHTDNRRVETGCCNQQYRDA